MKKATWSISGNFCILPEGGGHSILKVLLWCCAGSTNYQAKVGPQCKPTEALMAVTVLQRMVDEIKVAAQNALKDFEK